jgi:hypothetical protein
MEFRCANPALASSECSTRSSWGMQFSRAPTHRRFLAASARAWARKPTDLVMRVAAVPRPTHLEIRCSPPGDDDLLGSVAGMSSGMTGRVRTGRRVRSASSGALSVLVGRPGTPNYILVGRRRRFDRSAREEFGRRSGVDFGPSQPACSRPKGPARHGEGVFPRLRRGANAVCWHRGAMQRYDYQVQQLRESMIGGKLSQDKLERLLNDEARKGWRLKAITSADVKGRVGPGGVEGLIITFERPVG